MTGPSDWTLVTVSYNSAETLRRCWSDVDLGGARWVVVDNDSADDSVEVARALGADVIVRTTNDGFSVANNAALATVTTPWAMFVNPDVVIADPAGLDRLASIAGNQDALVAPRLLNPDLTDQRNGRGLPLPSYKLANRGVRIPGVDLEQYAQGGHAGPTYIAWAIGAAIGGSTALFRELGGWDERYFIYYEDHDIGLRSWLAGHPVILDPTVAWVHEWQRATTRVRIDPWKHELRSARVFYREYPMLRSRRRADAAPALARLRERLWSPVN